MRDLFLLAGEVQAFCRERGWKFCFIGGLALQRWGLPRGPAIRGTGRRTRFLADFRLHTCSAEDLVVLKAFADRSRDWADIEGILIRTGSRLDWRTVDAELQPLCEAKDAPHILPRLAALRTGP
ncbi:MAG: hypothetical protein OXQ31_10555 [Spirochaetaceae bacterium]|nr:hypothetical protein [Spirochaetaceae bacterium]